MPTKRDYKAEYRKFQSSPKMKKYRAELNKYNRQKGTYGNGDGKDASHKGGKIVGFEAQSKNRGRAEKSRLKKESMNEQEMSIKDAFKDLVKDHGAKKALDMLADVLTGGALAAMDPKKVKAFKKKLLKKVTTEAKLNENPAAIAAAQSMVVQSKSGKVSVNTARQSSYAKKDSNAHKKAKSMWQRIKDKFSKKEGVNEAQNKIADIRKILKTKKGKRIDSIFMDVETAAAINKKYKSLGKHQRQKFITRKIQHIVKSVKESINEEKYVVYVDKDGKGVRGRKIVKSDLTYNSAKRLTNKLVKTDDYQEVGFDDHKSWNQNNIEKINEGDTESRELKLYIDNDSQLYNSRFMPIIKNLSKKMKKGNYDKKLAIKGFMYLVDDGAKKYVKEFGGNARDMFSKKDRIAVASDLADEFEEIYKNKEYSFMESVNENTEKAVRLMMKRGSIKKGQSTDDRVSSISKWLSKYAEKDLPDQYSSSKIRRIQMRSNSYAQDWWGDTLYIARSILKEGKEKIFPPSKVDAAVRLAKRMGGNMTNAVKKIEKMAKGLSKNSRVQYALRQANEGLGDKLGKSIGKYNKKRKKNMDALKKLKKKKPIRLKSKSGMGKISHLGMESINEEKYFDPNGELKKYMDNVLKKAGIRVIKYDPMKQSFYNGIWGGFYTVASSNKVDMPGHGKVKRSSAVLPVYIDKKSQIELGVSGDGFKLGKAGSSQVLKNLKDFKKGDLDEGTCGYSIDGKGGDKPAGPHLLKKKKKYDVNEAKDPDIIAQIRGVLKKGYSAVKDPVSKKKMKMDTYTASAITQVYDALNTTNKKKFSSLPLLKMQKLAFKFVK